MSTKTPMLLRSSTLDCKFELADGLERDLFNALQAAHIEKGTYVSTNGADFHIEVTEYNFSSITEIDLVVVIAVQQGASDPVYHERRKITLLKSGSNFSMFRDIKTTNRALFKDIEIAVDQTESTLTGKLHFNVTGLDATATQTSFKYFTQLKM